MCVALNSVPRIFPLLFKKDDLVMLVTICNYRRHFNLYRGTSKIFFSYDYLITSASNCECMWRLNLYRGSFTLYFRDLEFPGSIPSSRILEVLELEPSRPRAPELEPEFWNSRNSRTRAFETSSSKARARVLEVLEVLELELSRSRALGLKSDFRTSTNYF